MMLLHSSALASLLPSIDLGVFDQAAVASSSVERLLLATALGGAVGFTRERKHRAAGLRTNMLLCLGCALFTLLSVALAGDSTPNKGQVAANIVQGIGFLGAGLILHNRDRVLGLTSAAGIFVVASIGMACGAGLYWVAIIATAIVIAATEMIGWMEFRLNLKAFSRVYEARGLERDRLLAALAGVMDAEHLPFHDYNVDTIAGIERVRFEVVTVASAHDKLEAALKQAQAVTEILVFNEMGED